MRRTRPSPRGAGGCSAGIPWDTRARGASGGREAVQREREQGQKQGAHDGARAGRGRAAEVHRSGRAVGSPDIPPGWAEVDRTRPRPQGNRSWREESRRGPGSRAAPAARGAGPHWAGVQALLARHGGFPACRGAHLASAALHRCACPSSERPRPCEASCPGPLSSPRALPAVTAAEKSSPARTSSPAPGAALNTGFDGRGLASALGQQVGKAMPPAKKGLSLFQAACWGQKARCCKTQDIQAPGQSYRRSGPGTGLHRLVSVSMG